MNNFASREFYSIVIGGSVLALNAGFINVVTLAGVFSVTVSHHTGNVSKTAIALYNWDLTTLALVTSIVFSYMFGSFIAGFMVGDNKFRLGRSYGYSLMVESACLFGSFVFLRRELLVGEWFAAFGCGLQNALATSYSGAVVRTTHMTGILTDIGNILGQACRADTTAELWRLKVHVPLLASYFFGGLMGQVSYNIMHEKSLLLPCFFTGGIACVYLTMPMVKEATVVLQETVAHMGLLGAQPAVEVRMVGDPREHDVYAKVQGRNVDVDIRNFLADIEEDEEGGKGGGRKMSQQKPLEMADARKRSLSLATSQLVAGELKAAAEERDEI
ncbi:uncharacterized protein EV422DRAFT_551654 [Fimicolochytrium jonesii]|uniref:uncharacterized protein n=1 Tax=Fimicolochytrium jonesii TaxID=1396493 RepID=UPI0022FDBA8C|nr:uncharacterized protein EV422DRAFT_551654 [Fimicolochytrium jonesii]KAI8816458.1 hypothetical protein EV422DRAFT_551654 [Fimicolochytrium jonesii]